MGQNAQYPPRSGLDFAYGRSPYEVGSLLDSLEKVGVSKEEIRERYRLTTPPHRTTTGRTWDLLCLLEAVRQVAPPDIGLQMGKSLHMNQYGGYYRRFADCQTMGDARQIVRQFCDETDQMYCYREAIDCNEWTIDFALPIPVTEGAHFLIDDLIARSKFEIEHLLGETISFCRIELPFPEPRHRSVYESMFDCRIAFGKPQARVVMSREYLDRPCAIGRQCSVPRASSITTGKLDQSEIANSDAERVALAILKTLIFAPGTYPSLNQVADTFRVSTSTVKRWLGANELNYRLLVDMVRSEHVAEYLAFTDLSPKEIAFRLGFTNVHNFRRAFRRWMDMTPGEFRQLARASNTAMSLRSPHMISHSDLN